MHGGRELFFFFFFFFFFFSIFAVLLFSVSNFNFDNFEKVWTRKCKYGEFNLFSISAVFDDLNLHDVSERSVLEIQIFITHLRAVSVSYYYGCWVALTRFCRVQLSKKITNICYVYVILLFM